MAIHDSFNGGAATFTWPPVASTSGNPPAAPARPKARRPQPSRPEAGLLARWAPWAAGFRDDVVITDGLFEPGVTVSDDGSTVRLYDEIGFWGCSATEFAEALDKANADEFTLRINSPGGDVFDGLAIYNSVRSHPATVHVAVDGIAASAASFIAMAGDDVTMMRGSQMMIHDALGLCIGNAANARRLADLLDLQSDNIAGLYAARAGGDAADWRATMRDERWYLAQDAVEAGLADRTDDDEAEESAPVDTLRMAWHEWIRAYAGREQTPTPAAPPEREPEQRPAATAFPWDPDSIISAVERQGR